MSCSAVGQRATVRLSTGPRCGKVGPVRGSAGLDPKVPRAPARPPFERVAVAPALPWGDVARCAVRRREDGRGARRRAPRRRLGRRRHLDRRGRRRATVVLEHEFAKVRVVPSAAWAVADADVVVVAVKPTDVAATLETARARARARHSRAVDRRRRHDRPPRSARARSPGRARDAEHAGARGCGRVGDRGRNAREQPSTSTSPSGCSARWAWWCGSASPPSMR